MKYTFKHERQRVELMVVILACNGDKLAAAKAMGVSFKTVYNRLNRGEANLRKLEEAECRKAANATLRRLSRAQTGQGAR